MQRRLHIKNSNQSQCVISYSNAMDLHTVKHQGCIVKAHVSSDLSCSLVVRNRV